MSFNDYTKPKNGTNFKGIGVARISGDNQDEKSWEDQEAFYREWLDRTFCDWKQCSGLLSDCGGCDLCWKDQTFAFIQYALWIVVLAGNCQSNKCSGDRF